YPLSETYATEGFLMSVITSVIYLFGRLPVTSVQLVPPFVVTESFASSVPTYMAVLPEYGADDIHVIVPSLPLGPRIRSGLIAVHKLPLLVDLKILKVPMYNVDELILSSI